MESENNVLQIIGYECSTAPWFKVEHVAQSPARNIPGVVDFLHTDVHSNFSQVEDVSNSNSNSLEDSEPEDSDDEFPVRLYGRNDGGTLV